MCCMTIFQALLARGAARGMHCQTPRTKCPGARGQNCWIYWTPITIGNKNKQVIIWWLINYYWWLYGDFIVPITCMGIISMIIWSSFDYSYDDYISFFDDLLTIFHHLLIDAHLLKSRLHLSYLFLSSYLLLNHWSDTLTVSYFLLGSVHTTIFVFAIPYHFGWFNIQLPINYIIRLYIPIKCNVFTHKPSIHIHLQKMFIVYHISSLHRYR